MMTQMLKNIWTMKLGEALRSIVKEELLIEMQLGDSEVDVAGIIDCFEVAMRSLLLQMMFDAKICRQATEEQNEA
jgi:hypothetical protein